LPTSLAIPLALLAALAWGSGDFMGGLASRRAAALWVTGFAQIVGLFVLLFLALAFGQPLPAGRDLLIAVLASVSGVTGLAALYRALAIGQMGIVAPITAVLSAGIPALYGSFRLGVPAAATLLGFALALVAIALISGGPRAAGRPAGLGLALLAGLGFGGFLVLLPQADPAVNLWTLTMARATSAAIAVLLALLRRTPLPATRGAVLAIAGAGVMDSLGNALYTAATGLGRLDVAAVLGSLYPAATVGLAMVFLRERLRPLQLLGVLLALIAIVLVALPA